MDRTTRLGAAVVTALALLLSACGGGPDPDPDSASRTTGTPSSGPSSGEASPSASVSPATGAVMRLPGATLRAPRGWSVEESDIGLLWDARRPDARISVFFSQLRGPVASLEQLLDVGALSSHVGRPRLSYDAELGGEPAFRADGRDALGPRVTYGAVHDGPATADAVGASVAFLFDPSLPMRERRAVEESVLASFQWR